MFCCLAGLVVDASTARYPEDFYFFGNIVSFL